MFPTSGRRLIVLGAAIFVFSAACGGADTPSGPTSPGGSPRGSGDDSRASADDSRKDADSRPDAPSAPSGPFFRAAADHGELAAFTLDHAVVGADGTLRIEDGDALAGTDPEPSGYHGGSFYNGGSFRYAVTTSPEWKSAATFDTVTPSFEASTPPGTWIHVKLAARIGSEWTKEYSLGVWADDEGSIRRHSVEGQADANGDVATDTLVLNRPADALRITTVLFAEGAATPSLRAVSAVATAKTGTAPSAAAGDSKARGKVLAVPKRSQMIYPNGGEAWCSPTSTSMLLGYWADMLGANGLRETPPEAAGRCLDHVYDGTGNWPFNTAHAAAMDGGRLHGAVTRLASFEQVEQLIGAGIPVAISIRYERGELTGSPVGATDGHLIVVRGFAANGDVVCNDPAFGSDAAVEVTYDRAELTKAWQHSRGTTYLVWPTGQDLPIDTAGAFH
jgi:Peptidase_C39 like family